MSYNDFANFTNKLSKQTDVSSQVRMIGKFFGDIISTKKVDNTEYNPVELNHNLRALVAGLLVYISQRHFKTVPPQWAINEKALKKIWNPRPFYDTHLAMLETPAEVISKGVIFSRRELENV
jgi:hypothetical protein